MSERDPGSAFQDDAGDTAKRHFRFGWWCLFLFSGLGLLLEVLHGFKLGFYLDLANETRRHMWTLAHAHGTLLALVNLGLAATLQLRCTGQERWIAPASRCLMGATLLLPGGFFLGGVVIYAGDPGLGVLLVPVGALLLLVAAFLTARGLGAARVER
jgi:hypothetical protein